MLLAVYALQTLTCCLFLVSAQPLPPVALVLKLQLPQSVTHSHLTFVTLPLPILSATFFKLTAYSRSSTLPSGLPKRLRFGHWLTLCTERFTYLLTYLLTCKLNVATLATDRRTDGQTSSLKAPPLCRCELNNELRIAMCLPDGKMTIIKDRTTVISIISSDALMKFEIE